MSERLRPFLTEIHKNFLIDDLLTKWGARGVAEIFFRLVAGGINVEGQKNIPEDFNTEPYIVAFNHSGWTEVLVFPKVFFPRWVYMMGKTEIFDRKLLGPAARRLGHFPIRRGEVHRQALAVGQSLLKQGEILGMAPEGTRGRREGLGKLRKGKKGTIFLGIEAGVAIIPTAILGPEKILPLIEEEGLSVEELKLLIKQRPLIFVRIGKPFTQHLEERFRRPNKLQFEGLTTNLMLEIRDMLPPECHGFYKGVKRQPL